MKDIRLIQYEKIRKQYQELIKLDDRQFSQSDVLSLRNNIIFSDSKLPMSGKYRVGTNSTIDIKSFNAEMMLLKSDIESVFDYLSCLEYKKREMEYIIETHSNYTKNVIDRANKDIRSLSSGRFVNGLTQEIDFVENADESLTTAIIADSKLTMPVTGIISDDHTFTAGEVSISRLGPEYRVEVIGTPVDIMNPGSNGKLTLRLYPKNSNTYETCGFRFDISAYIKNTNYIFIRMAETGSGVNIKAELLDNNKSTRIYDSVVKSDTVDITFNRQSVNRTTISFTMDVPNSSINGEPVYEWTIYSLRVMNTIREQSCEYVTKQISIEPEIDYVQLVGEDEITGNGSIKYYLTSKIDDDGKPTAFSEVLADDDTFTFSSQKQQVLLSPAGSRWNMVKYASRDKRLYNILDCIDDLDYGAVKIISGEIVTTSGEVELIQDGIHLYNGINNYRVETTDEGTDISSKTISYATMYNPDTEWVEKIPLRINIDREPISNITYNQGTDTSTITTIYEVVAENNEHIKLYDADNKLMDIQIINISGETIQVSGAIDTSNRVYGDYIAPLSNYLENSSNTEMDYSSIQVVVGDDEYEINKDFIIHTTESLYSIELLKTGGYTKELDVYIDTDSSIYNNSPYINIRFNCKTYGRTTKRVFATNVYCNRYTDTTILPFTPEEISAGNFHVINDKNVSTDRKYTLQPGWNTIRTTQPYPTKMDNIFDVNIFTKKPSAAGVIIPEDIDIMRPYTDSMRQVSPFTLSVSNVDEKECFAYENGKIYINYLPDYIDPGIINDDYYGNITGSRFICKSAVYGADMKTTGYIPVPEQFMLEIKYREIGEDRNVYVKIELSTAGSTGNARVFRLGLNKFKED